MVPKLSFDTGYPMQHEPRSPFEVTAARSLRFVVDDAEVVRPSPAMRLLVGFEHHEGVAIYRTGAKALRHLQLRESREDDAAYATVVEEDGHSELFIGGLSNKEGLAAN